LLDQKKGSLSNPQEISSEIARRLRESRLLIMVTRGVGRVRSYDISPRILIFVIIFIVLYFTMSIFFIHGYLHQRQVNINLDNKLRQLERRQIEKEKALNLARNETDKLKDVIKNLEREPNRELGITKGDNFIDKATKYDTGKTTIDTYQKDKQKNIVDIEDIAIRRESGKLTVNFKLVKVKSGEDPVMGYIHILAIGQNSDEINERTYPQEKIQNEVPISSRQTSTFSIQRFKLVKHEFILDGSSEPPSSIKILVYDKSGMLLLEKLV
jgi:hypothetical protein